MDFQAEIIRTSQRKLVSNDNQYEIVLRTNNPLILDLGKLPGTTLVDCKLDIASNNSEDIQDLGDFQ